MLAVHALVARAFTTQTDQTATTALGIVFRLETMALFVGLGWGSAAQTFVGQNLGARRKHRAIRSGWLAALYNLVRDGAPHVCVPGLRAFDRPLLRRRSDGGRCRARVSLGRRSELSASRDRHRSRECDDRSGRDAYDDVHRSRGAVGVPDFLSPSPRFSYKTRRRIASGRSWQPRTSSARWCTPSTTGAARTCGVRSPLRAGSRRRLLLGTCVRGPRGPRRILGHAVAGSRRCTAWPSPRRNLRRAADGGTRRRRSRACGSRAMRPASSWASWRAPCPGPWHSSHCTLRSDSFMVTVEPPGFS